MIALQLQIEKAIERALLQLDQDDKPLPKWSLESPAESKFGDYATNVALLLAKKQGKSPQTVAQSFVTTFYGDKHLKLIVDRIEVAGAGFVNFFLSKEYLSQNVLKVLEKGEAYGKSDIDKGKKVVVEYSSPNIAKPFTVGHFRSTIIGDAVANLMEATGWEVHRDNHLGDWGTQFGKQIYAIKTWGNIEEIEKSDRPVKLLVDLYVKFHDEAEKDKSLEGKAREWFKKLEKGDKEARELWQKCVEWSMKEFKVIYDQLGIKFNQEFNNGVGLGESFFVDKMESIKEELESKGLMRDGEEGAKLVFFPGDEYPPLMVWKKDDSSLYATRDLATDRYRLDTFGSDIVIINEVGAEQSLYFKQLYKTEELLGWIHKGQRIHIRHGHFRFADQKMSTRKGNVIWLEDVINSSIENAKKLGNENLELATNVGIGALKWNELKRDPIQDIVFDWEEILNMQGNSGPYMQYTHARIQSVIDKSAYKEKTLNFENFVWEDVEILLSRKLAQYEGVVILCSKMYSTNLLTNYLFDLAQCFNQFYNSSKIVGSDKEQGRILLSKATGQVIKNGLNLLGISSPERM